jgi:hypothetical protein
MLSIKDVNVPIVGAAYTLKGWFLTLNLVCNCEAKESLLLVGSLGAVAKCPACHAAYQLQGVASDTAANRMQFSIGVGHAAPTPVPAADVVK